MPYKALKKLLNIYCLCLSDVNLLVLTRTALLNITSAGVLSTVPVGSLIGGIALGYDYQRQLVFVTDWGQEIIR
jgi:hypothetical protein